MALNVMHENELIRVRVDLDADQYVDADRAHMTGAFVQIEGILSSGRRIHRITELRNFRIIN